MATCGNEPLDARLIEVIENMPQWNPAKDANGKADGTSVRVPRCSSSLRSKATDGAYPQV